MILFLILIYFLFLWGLLQIFFWIKFTYNIPFKNGFEECVLITGCDSGIGYNTCIYLSNKGFTIFAICLNENSFELLQKNTKGTIIPIQCDITKDESVKKMGVILDSELKKEKNRRLFGVINNAGVITNGPIEMQPINNIQFQIDVNVIGQIRVIQETTKYIRQSKGRIINTVSIAGRTTTGAIGAYSASKHAMEAITDALRSELKPWNISVSAIEPGIIDTPLARQTADHENIWNKLYDGASDIYPKLYKETKEIGILGYFGQPVDTVTKAMEHALCSKRPKTRYLVGKDAKFLAFIKWSCSDRLFDILSSTLSLLSPIILKITKKKKFQENNINFLE